MSITSRSIQQEVNVIERERDDARGRLREATSEGGTLAAAVYAFLDDPDAVGTDALHAAYSRFMGRHSANFTPEG